MYAQHYSPPTMFRKPVCQSCGYVSPLKSSTHVLILALIVHIDEHWITLCCDEECNQTFFQICTIYTAEHVVLEHGFLEHIVFPLPNSSLFIFFLFTPSSREQIQIVNMVSSTSSPFLTNIRPWSREIKQILRVTSKFNVCITLSSRPS